MKDKKNNILVFDPRNIHFKKAGIEIRKVVLNLLAALLLAFGFTVVGYVLFALVYSTDEERHLARENRIYEKVLPEVEEREMLLEEAITDIQYKDSRIYEQVFHSSAPNADPMSNLDFLFASDTIPDTKLVSYVRDKSDALLAKAGEIEDAFGRIFEALADTSRAIPPMRLPLKDGISYTQVGASTGSKMSPFLKTYVYHDGLDLIVLRGSEVVAPADGTVIETGNDKSDGRYVLLAHRGGYTTRFNHLEAVEVKKGREVTAGTVIGNVGMSGNSSAPHLHYEVRRDSVVVDPVNYLFASISPSDYANMLYMSVNTVQSMD